MNNDNFYELLKRCEFDPSAARGFEVFTAGFMWSDEVPAASIVGETLRPIIMIRLQKVFLYRTSLSFISPRVEFEHNWNELKKNVPTWPGFREERIYGEIQRLLKIHHYQLNRGLRKGGQLDRLFDELDEPEKE